MLLVYDKTTGSVLDNAGTSSAYPSGPPEDLAFLNTDARGIDRARLALLRLHDGDDADLVAQILTNRHHVDPKTGRVVIDGPYPQPAPGEPEPTLLDRLAAIEAEVKGMKDRAKVEAAKSTPTAKGVAAAIAADSA